MVKYIYIAILTIVISGIVYWLLTLSQEEAINLATKRMEDLCQKYNMDCSEFQILNAGDKNVGDWHINFVKKEEPYFYYDFNITPLGVAKIRCGIYYVEDKKCYHEY